MGLFTTQANRGVVAHGGFVGTCCEKKQPTSEGSELGCSEMFGLFGVRLASRCGCSDVQKIRRCSEDVRVDFLLDSGRSLHLCGLVFGGIRKCSQV